MDLDVANCLTVKALFGTPPRMARSFLFGSWGWRIVDSDAKSTGPSSSPFAECFLGVLYNLLIFPSGDCFYRYVSFGLLMHSISPGYIFK